MDERMRVILKKAIASASEGSNELDGGSMSIYCIQHNEPIGPSRRDVEIPCDLAPILGCFPKWVYKWLV